MFYFLKKFECINRYKRHLIYVFRGSMAKILFNFLISPQNKLRFEAVCASNGLSMSGVLNALIDTYVIDQAENVEHRAARFQRLDAVIGAIHSQHGHHQREVLPDDDDGGPLSIFYDDGGDFYESNF
jgi:hypothetical protein